MSAFTTDLVTHSLYAVIGSWLYEFVLDVQRSSMPLPRPDVYSLVSSAHPNRRTWLLSPDSLYLVTGASLAVNAAPAALSIAVHPHDSEIAYLGAASGRGLWKRRLGNL